MKKIISLLASIAMLASMFTSVSAAELANNNPVLETSIEEMAADDQWFIDNEVTLEEGQKAYMMNMNLTGVDLSIKRYDSTTNGKKGRVGVVIQQLEYKLVDIVGEENIVEIFQLDEGFAPGQGSFQSFMNANSVNEAYPQQTNNNSSAAVEETEAFINNYVVITNGKVVTGDIYVTLKISVADYDTTAKKSYFPGGNQTKEWSTLNGSMALTVNGETATAVTLGEEGGDAPIIPDEPKEMDVVIGAEYVLEAGENKGLAWDVVVSNYDAEKTLTATFKDADTQEVRMPREITGLESFEGTSFNFVALLKLTSGDRNVDFKIEY